MKVVTLEAAAAVANCDDHLVPRAEKWKNEEAAPRSTKHTTVVFTKSWSISMHIMVKQKERNENPFQLGLSRYNRICNECSKCQYRCP